MMPYTACEPDLFTVVFSQLSVVSVSMTSVDEGEHHACCDHGYIVSVRCSVFMVSNEAEEEGADTHLR